jgi:hypothetical protein
MSELEALFKFFGPGAIFVIGVVAIWRIVFTPRKRKDSEGRERERSAIAVAGWQHDQLLDDMDALRTQRDRREQEIQAETERRVAEWRTLRDEERARAAESDVRLREMDSRLDRFDDILDQMLGLLTELAERARAVPHE